MGLYITFKGEAGKLIDITVEIIIINITVELINIDTVDLSTRSSRSIVIDYELYIRRCMSLTVRQPD